MPESSTASNEPCGGLDHESPQSSGWLDSPTKATTADECIVMKHRPPPLSPLQTTSVSSLYMIILRVYLWLQIPLFFSCYFGERANPRPWFCSILCSFVLSFYPGHHWHWLTYMPYALNLYLWSWTCILRFQRFAKGISWNSLINQVAISHFCVSCQVLNFNDLLVVLLQYVWRLVFSHVC